MVDLSIFIGGQAGEGIKKGASVIGKIFNRFGYHVFIYSDYGSIIRGGQDYSEIRVKDKPCHSQYGKFDFMFAFHSDVFERYKDKRKTGCFDCVEGSGFSFESAVKELNGKPFMKPSAVAGIVSYMLCIPFELVEEVLKDEFGEHAEPNIELARLAYEHARSNGFPVSEIGKGEKPAYPLVSGNESIGLGALRAGIRVYTAYPITPASTLLEFLAKNSKRTGTAVIHTEDEIASILMAIGAAYAGAPAMTGSSGAGIDLMGEAISMAGACEVPLVILDVQRAGPSTGAPTYSEQSDLNLARNIGHGEFPRIVLAIGSIEDAFEITAKAFQYAWWYQTPVILLSDKHISESVETVMLPFSQRYPLPIKEYQEETVYKRYADADDGISPLAFPGREKTVVHVNSTEHTEDGYSSSIALNVKKMKEKRLKKMQTIINDFRMEKTLNVYGNKNARTVLIGFGSTKGAILEAIDGLEVKYMQIVSIEPFPSEKLKEEIPEGASVYCIENNSTGQLADLFEMKMLRKLNGRILKYDGRPFDPWELRQVVEEVMK